MKKIVESIRRANDEMEQGLREAEADHAKDPWRIHWPSTIFGIAAFGVGYLFLANGYPINEILAYAIVAIVVWRASSVLADAADYPGFDRFNRIISLPWTKCGETRRGPLCSRTRLSFSMRSPLRRTRRV